MVSIKFSVKKLKNKLLLSDVFSVAGGTIIAQGFIMAIMPLLSRIYTPDDFGVASAFASIMSILIPLSSLRYFLAIALPKTQKYAGAIVNLSFMIQCIYFGLISVVFILFGNTLLAYFNMEIVSSYKILIPFAVLGASIYEMLTQCAIRAKLFSIIARTKVSQSLSGGFAKVCLGWLGMRPLGLILGTIIGQAGGITSVTLALHKMKFFRRIKWFQIRRAALQYRNFPLYAMPTAIINTAGTQIIPLMVFSFYGATVAGYFSMAHQLLMIPSVFVGNAIGQVFLQRASVAKYSGGLGALCWNTYKTLWKVGIIPMVILVIAAPFVFKFVLGNTWEEAGEYAKLLAPITMASFAFSPISHVFNIQNRQDIALKLEIVYFATQILGFLIGTLYQSARISICLYSLGGAAMVGVRTYWALKVAK